MTPVWGRVDLRAARSHDHPDGAAIVQAVDVEIVDLADSAAAVPGAAAVVIDVLRACTTAAAAFEAGAAEIVAVASVEQALGLRERCGDVVLMGEVDGLPVPGFDLPNSPTIVATAALAGRVVVHRTTAGTQGLVQSAAAQVLLAGAFVNAAATVAHLERLSPRRVVLVVTGSAAADGGDEDRACAEYLAALLGGHRPDPAPYLERVRRSAAARKFAPDGPLGRYHADVERCAALDTAPYALSAEVAGGYPRLRAGV